ncbi:hypothetical protein GPECTOR_15g344 [Gonium pectorale]|uniref:Protein kinase domain-containing protein n=1 Tax=Gonium pectorale TaxID=33097 RepID=A0A150GMT4_GONPE|nr:hypothetical protein GPECTOR_15g344 [Gonium pectorale]|eukprot:KXZ50660.1 hypothetical protein GPECTOR_15g344 [Gonium pectorale]
MPRRRATSAELQERDLEIQRVLGCGTSGVVYLGMWRGLSVAVKTLVVPDVSAAEGRAHQRAALEAAISMSMGHPNVVATYTYQLKPLVHEQQAAAGSRALGSGGTTSQSAGPSQVAHDGKAVVEIGGDAYKLYIVQELCNGGTLRQALAQGVAGSVRAGGSSRLLALRLALDVAQGMRHVHSCRIVHGDLKPDNVLLRYKADDDGLLKDGTDLASTTATGAGGGGDGSVPLVAKVADFGLSLALAEGATHASHHFHGTPAYVAPEVFAEGRVSTRADVWSFGLMLIELFYGCTLEDMRALAPAATATAGLALSIHQALLQDMLATSQRYGKLASDCLSVDVHARPDFVTITARLLEVLTTSGASYSEAQNPDGLKHGRFVWPAQPGLA